MGVEWFYQVSGADRADTLNIQVNLHFLSVEKSLGFHVVLSNQVRVELKEVKASGLKLLLHLNVN